MLHRIVPCSWSLFIVNRNERNENSHSVSVPKWKKLASILVHMLPVSIYKFESPRATEVKVKCSYPKWNQISNWPSVAHFTFSWRESYHFTLKHKESNRSVLLDIVSEREKFSAWIYSEKFVSVTKFLSFLMSKLFCVVDFKF